MRNFFAIVVSLCFSNSALAQDYSANWEDYFSYYEIVDIHSSGNRVFAAAKNSVFSYNPVTGEAIKFSTINGLAGENVSAIHFSSTSNVLVVGYETGLINVYNFSTGNTLQVIDITERQTISPANRRINDFFEVNGQLLISTNYGISEFNLSNLEFGDTFYIGNAGSQLGVNEIVVFNEVIYAATQGGSVRYADLNNPNLIDFNQWQQVSNLGNVRNISVFNNEVVAVGNGQRLYEINANSANQIINLNGNVNDLLVRDNTLYVVYNSLVRGYNTSFNIIYNFGSNLDFIPRFLSIGVIDDRVFVGDANRGLLYTSQSNANFQYVSPQGPLRNSIFQMQAIPNELWTVFGDYNIFFNPYAGGGLKRFGASHLINDEWVNIPFEEINANNLVNIAINPRNVDHVFLSSFNDGLVEIQDNEVVNLYNEENSPIEEMIDGQGNIEPNDTRVNGIAFDRNGTLWGNVARVVNGLFSLSPGSGNFNVFDVTEVMPNNTYYTENFGFTDIVIDDSGNLYYGSYASGVVAFQPSTNTFARIIGDESQGNLPDNYVTNVALDNNNQLWIGTVRGLRVLFNPTGIFTNPNTQAQEIIILDDDGVAQELLANISISDIEVDGNNNKWIATESGAFYLSSNGQETLYNFTTENSPLPSNTVTDIEVDGSSGRVYFGTPQGIVAFNGTATSAQDSFENVRAFPNPVRPNYSGMVTIDGLMENANVKITDIEGNLVYEEVSQGGSIQWDTRAFGKHKVASGVYMVLIISEDQLETKVTKIMIIR